MGYTGNKKRQSILSRTALVAVLFAVMAALVTLGAGRADAGQASLSWSAPTTNTNGTTLTDLGGFKIHIGNASRSYSQHIDVGKMTNYVAANLTDGSTYYFAVTAYDTSGLESGYSNEVSKVLTATTSYTITATAGSGGTVTALNNTKVSTATNSTSTISSVTVSGGASQAFSIAPSSGYTIQNVTVDGTSVGAVTSYTFNNVTANHTIQASFSASGTSGTGSTTGSTTFAVNSGGASYTSGSGVTYAADTKFSGGSTGSTTSTITGTSDGTLYQTERYGNFSYSIPVSNGNYNVALKFAETYFSAAGQRVFSVAINGSTVISNLDIYAKAGKNAAYDVVVPVSVSNGAINITFTSQVNNAEVRAIKVDPATATTAGVLKFATNSGGSSYTGGSGITYSADTGYTGGTVGTTTATISGTTDGTLYQSERYGNFSYSIPLSNGNYSVTLKFAEGYFSAAGQRVFNVGINGSSVISNLDIYAKAGKNAAYDVVLPVSVTNGTLKIDFISQVNNAEVRGIVVKTM